MMSDADVYTSIMKYAGARTRALARARRDAGVAGADMRSGKNATAYLLTASSRRNNFLHGVTHA